MSTPGGRGRNLGEQEQLGAIQRKRSVLVASTGNIASLGDASTTIDGVTLVRGDRALLKDQTTASQNGLYVFAYPGSSSTKMQLVRSEDGDDSGDLVCGVEVYVEKGTLNKQKRFVLSTVNPITVNTTALTFVDVTASAAAKYVTAGEAISANDLVYFSGWDATNGIVKVKKADADVTATVGTRHATYIAPAAIGNGAQGYVYKAAYVGSLNTNAGNVDDPVYLSTTAGGWSLSTPVGNARHQVVGRVAVKSATVGAIQFLLNDTDAEKISTYEIADGTILPADVDLTQNYAWTGVHTFNPAGGAPATALELIRPAAAPSPGQVDSHDITLGATSDDGAAHAIKWKQFVDVTSNAGASKLALQAKLDAGAYVEKVSINDQGTLTLTAPTGVQPGFAAAGADANHDLTLTPKGTGAVDVTSHVIKGVSNPTALGHADRREWAVAAADVAANVAVTAAMRFRRADTTGGNVQYDLPAAATSAGLWFIFKKIIAANSMIIKPNGAEVIDGAVNLTVNAQWASVTVVCDGTAWFVV